MNDEIALMLMKKLLHLDYIEKFGGIVQTKLVQQPRQGQESKTRKFPSSRVFKRLVDSLDPEACDREEIIKCGLKSKLFESFVPESKLKGMIYFEDQGVRPDSNRRHSSLNFYTASIRLVGWFNQKHFKKQFDANFRGNAISEIVSHLLKRSKHNKSDLLKLIVVTFDGIPELSNSIFAEYDYDERETQYMAEPYDFFALDFEVSFGISKTCFIPVITEQTTKC